MPRSTVERDLKPSFPSSSAIPPPTPARRLHPHRTCACVGQHSAVQPLRALLAPRSQVPPCTTADAADADADDDANVTGAAADSCGAASARPIRDYGPGVLCY